MAEPENKENSGGENNIDLSKILLPKKDGPSPASAARVNAGELLAQEQQAAAGGIPKEEKAPEPAVVPPVPPKEETLVQPLQTYQHDIESVVEKSNTSVVSIAAAEAERRARTAQESPAAAPRAFSWWRAAMWGGGVVLLAAALGLLSYVLFQLSSVAVPPAPQAPFIFVDSAQVVSLTPESTRTEAMQRLQTAQQESTLSLGLIEQLLVTTGSGETLQQVGIQNLLALFAPTIPEQFLRTLGPTYLLGVHSYDENQAFLVLLVDSYDSAYAGLLAWEPTMRSDLSPLFTRTPPIHAAPLSAATSTASSTPPSSTVALTFVDRIVENHDARVIQNSYGDILLLWTFLSRNVVVIATNEATLREIISRANTAPVQSLPQ